jgi:hypothetical protein
MSFLTVIVAGRFFASADGEHQLHRHSLTADRKPHHQYSDRAFSGNGRAYTKEIHIAELGRLEHGTTTH